MNDADLSAERLRSVLSYDPITGEFRWLIKPSSRIHKGAAAGYIDAKGYHRIAIPGYGNKFAHRLAWLYMHGDLPKYGSSVLDTVDHIDGNRANNAISNLRLATRSQQNSNKPTPKNNKSGFKGVFFRPHAKRWFALIRCENRTINLGYFDTAEMAYDAYCSAAKRYHGEFAHLSLRTADVDRRSPRSIQT